MQSQLGRERFVYQLSDNFALYQVVEAPGGPVDPMYIYRVSCGLLQALLGP